MPIPSIVWNQHEQLIAFAGFKPDGTYDWCLALPGMYGATATGYVFVESIGQAGEASLISVDIPPSIVEDGVDKEFTGWIIRGIPDFVPVDAGNEDSETTVRNFFVPTMSWQEAVKRYRTDPDEKSKRKRFIIRASRFSTVYAPFAVVNDAIPLIGMIDDGMIPAGIGGAVVWLSYRIGRVWMIRCGH
jgi:hypothetical protein